MPWIIVSRGLYRPVRQRRLGRGSIIPDPVDGLPTKGGGCRDLARASRQDSKRAITGVTLASKRSGLEMSRFLALVALILCAGGAGGLAGYLLRPSEKEARSFFGAVRFITAGAIVAFAVPLFLSVAKSSLIADLLGKATSDQFFPNALVLIGFCVVAGFASRRFMNSLAARVMQIERKTEKAQETSEKAQQTSEKARETSERAQQASEKALENSEEAVETAEAVDESIGLAMANERHDGDGDEASAPMNAAIKELAATLGPDEKAVLFATGLHHERTITGISRDAQLPRKTVKKLVPQMVHRGLLQNTISADTGGSRIKLTSIGASIANILKSPPTSRFIDTTPAVADAADTTEETRGESEFKSGA
jgi:F0F1-type ATP synthase membrane subunit b/b'